jgi:hypothetical protein
MEFLGKATRLRQGYGAPSIEGKAAMVAASELGSERVSNERERVSQFVPPYGGRIEALKRRVAHARLARCELGTTRKRDS